MIFPSNGRVGDEPGLDPVAIITFFVAISKVLSFDITCTRPEESGNPLPILIATPASVSLCSQSSDSNCMEPVIL